MKTTFISSAVSLIIGFAFGWLIQAEEKKQNRIIESITTSARKPAPAKLLPNIGTASATQNSNPTGLSPNKPTERILKETVILPDTAERSERAKWLHLVETLNLDNQQTQALETILTEITQSKFKDTDLENAYINAGANLEARIKAVLNEEQQKEFAALQARNLEHRIETGVQEIVSKELRGFDFTPQQREKVQAALREREKQIAEQIPRSARLALANSFLPIGDERFSEESLLLLKQLKPEREGNPTIEELAKRNQNEQESKALLLEGILSPAQLELYRANSSKQAEFFNRMRDHK